MLAENIMGIVIWLLATVTALNAVFFCFVIYRRLHRKSYFRVKDAARELAWKPVVSFLRGESTLDQAHRKLERLRAPAEREAVQELIFEKTTAASTGRATELLWDLGFVERWARTAFQGKAERVMSRAKNGLMPARLPLRSSAQAPWLRIRLFSVPRALAVDCLGHLAPVPAQAFAVEALRDPAEDVRVVAIQALGRAANPTSLPLLLSELERALERGAEHSLDSLRAALACFQSVHATHFLAALTHSNERLRFTVVDILRQILEREARKGAPQLDAKVGDFIVERITQDPAPDVRARSAGVLAHLPQARARVVLRQLLEDENEFVRLHAVRACADARFSELAPDLLKRLTDSRWRVREAAVRALMRQGDDGKQRLLREFVTMADQYASEQVAEELQRSGVVPEVVAGLASLETKELAQAVCYKLVGLRKTAALTHALASAQSSQARLKLIEILMAAPTAELRDVLQEAATRDHGSVGRRAAMLLPQLMEKLVHADGVA